MSLRTESAGQTLQATALVHEAYLRLVAQEGPSHWDSRRHFFAAASEAMRRILIENARKKQARKRGGDWHRQPLDVDAVQAPEASQALLELDEALERLACADPQAALLVKLRYFTGLSVRESADVLDVSTRSAERLWTHAKAWLYREIRS